VLRPIEGIEPRYLAYWLQSDAYMCEANERASQTTNIANLRVSDLLSMSLPLPNNPAAQLGFVQTVDRQLGSHAHLRHATLLRASTAAATRRLAYERAFSTRSRLAIEPGSGRTDGWTWHKLIGLARLESGHTPSRRHPEWWSGGIPWIQLADIRAVDGQVIHETRETTNPDGIANSAARILPADTVVMSRTASVGFVTRMGRPMATSQDFVNWVCGPDLDPEFLMHLLIRSRDYVRSLSAGAVHRTVYYPTVKDFHVCIPPINEQRRIAAELRERLATIDAMTRAIEAQLEAIDALPAALLRRAFADLEAA
jgi:type I restriction enzyme S subunit